MQSSTNKRHSYGEQWHVWAESIYRKTMFYRKQSRNSFLRAIRQTIHSIEGLVGTGSAASALIRVLLLLYCWIRLYNHCTGYRYWIRIRHEGLLMRFSKGHCRLGWNRSWNLLLYRQTMWTLEVIWVLIVYSGSYIRNVSKFG